MAIEALHEKQPEQAKQALLAHPVDEQQFLQANAIHTAESQRQRDSAHNLPALAIVLDSHSHANDHQIKKNETLSEIVAREFNLHDWNSIRAKVLEIAAINHIADPDKIRDGRALHLTEPEQKVVDRDSKSHPDQADKQVPAKKQEPRDLADKQVPAKKQEPSDATDKQVPAKKQESTDEANQQAPAKKQETTDTANKIQTAPLEQQKIYDGSTATESPREKALREYQQEHDHLLDQASQKMTTSEREQFAASVRQFESRMPELARSYEKQGMNREDAEIRAFKEAQKTYEQIGRLIEAKDNPTLPVTEHQRITLAEQTMQHAANPTSIDQGQHRTCSVNSVETRTYTSTPSEAARMVADLATTGEYITTRDHVKVVLNKDDLTPDQEAAKAGKVDGIRDHASQLFQIGAVNVWYAGNEPNLRYEQRKIDPTLTPPDTGERIVDYSSNPPQIQRPGFFAKLTGTKEDEYNRPGLTNDKIVYAGNQIEGSQSKDWQLSSSNVKSLDELEAKLKDAKEHGKLPLVAIVHTGNEPFYTDSGAGTAGGSGGWHAVTITDYVAGQPAKVAVDNQWGSTSDHLGQNKINIQDMYNALNTPEIAAAAMEKNLPKDGTPHNQEQQFESLEVARIKHAAGKITDDQLAQTIAGELSDMHANGFDTRTKQKVTQLLQSLPCSKQLDLLTTAKADGVFDDGNLSYQLARIAHKVRQAFDDETVPHTEERLKQIKHLTVRISEMKSHLPEKDQRDFEDYMSQWHKLQP